MSVQAPFDDKQLKADLILHNIPLEDIQAAEKAWLAARKIANMEIKFRAGSLCDELDRASSSRDVKQVPPMEVSLAGAKPTKMLTTVGTSRSSGEVRTCQDVAKEQQLQVKQALTEWLFDLYLTADAEGSLWLQVDPDSNQAPVQRGALVLRPVARILEARLRSLRATWRRWHLWRQENPGSEVKPTVLELSVFRKRRRQATRRQQWQCGKVWRQ